MKRIHLRCKQSRKFGDDSKDDLATLVIISSEVFKKYTEDLKNIFK